MYDSFDTNSIADVRVALEDFLRDFKDLYGVELSIGRIRYDSARFSCRLSGKIVGELNKAEKDYVKRRRFDSTMYPLGTVIKDTHGQIYQIVGWSSRARKRPVLCRSINGEQWSMDEGYVSRCTVVELGDDNKTTEES